MKSFLAAAGLAGALVLSATSASATVQLDVGGGLGLPQVHSTGSQGPANTVFGVTQDVTNTLVSFSSGDALSVNGSGYAQFNGPFDDLSVFLTNGGAFSAIEFTLFGAGVNGANGVPIFVDITAFTQGGGSTLFNNVSLSQGVNRFGIFGDDNEVFTSISFASYANAGNTIARTIGDIRQVDLGAVSAIPEPATWGMMIIGFAGIGSMLRSSRRRSRPALA